MKILKLTLKIFLTIILTLTAFPFVNAVDCYPNFDGNWTVEADCTFPSGYKIYGNTIVGDKTVTINNGVTMGIDLSSNKITFTTGRINIGSTGKIDNSVSSRYYRSFSYSFQNTNNITACPSGTKVLNTSASAVQSGIGSVGSSGTMYCAKV